MHISQLLTFVELARCGTFHKAARHLHVTQAAVSARIGQLEAGLDVRLFERGRRGAVLTEAGRFLLPLAERMVKSWETTQLELRQRFSGRILLRLGVQLSIWDGLLIDLLVWVEKTMDKLPLSLNFDHDRNSIDMVSGGLLDLAVTHENPRRDLAHTALASEKLVLVASQHCSFFDADLPLFLNFQLGDIYDDFLREVLPSRAAQHIIMGNSSMGIAYLRRKAGMAYCPEAMVADEIEKGVLYKIGDAPELNIPCYAVYKKPTSAASDVIAHIVRGLVDLRRPPSRG